MAVLTHAHTPTEPAPAPATPAVTAPQPATGTAPLADHIDHHTLGDEQRTLVDDVLWDLGLDAGHTANNGGNPDPAWRLLRSAVVAAAIGLRLPASDELAECALCRTVLPASRTRECDDGLVRCTVADVNGTSCLAMYLGTL